MIYLVIDDYEDLEGHFDLLGVYFSKEDLVKDFEKLKEISSNFVIYRTDISCLGENLEYFCNAQRFEEEHKEKFEYQLYLELKEKYEGANE